jgi:membrane protein implicated in regulation of membrane protease activity
MRARLASLAAFFAFGLAAIAAYLWLRPAAVGIAAFAVLGIAGLWLSVRVFDRLASPEQRRADLEDRVRNPDL